MIERNTADEAPRENSENTPENTQENTPEDALVQGARSDLEIEALRQHMMRGWWWFCLALWLTIGTLSLWSLRSGLQELRAYFTWTALRYMLAYSRLAAAGLGLCCGLTLALLYAESRHILIGLSQREKRQLINRLAQIHQQGSSHPQWNLIAAVQIESAKK